METIQTGTLIIFKFRNWSDEIYFGIILESAFDSFYTDSRRIFYVYLMSGEHLFVTEDEITIMEII